MIHYVRNVHAKRTFWFIIDYLLHLYHNFHQISLHQFTLNRVEYCKYQYHDIAIFKIIVTQCKIMIYFIFLDFPLTLIKLFT